MKKKIVLTIMPFLLTAIYILGCGHRIEMKDEALEGMSGEEINTASENIVKISQQLRIWKEYCEKHPNKKQTI